MACNVSWTFPFPWMHSFTMIWQPNSQQVWGMSCIADKEASSSQGIADTEPCITCLQLKAF